MMNRFFTIFLLLFSTFTLKAQQLNPADFIYPVEDVARLYSANFGELRPDHFHSGIDIKTDGVQGKRVVAIADGYVSRISMTPGGYGLALYLTHPNGTTSVYAHLSRFTDDVASYVESERYRLKNHSVNLFCTPDQFPFSQGDLIGYSGNSGSSFGPHLHFEIRNSNTQEPINLVAQGVISPKDNIAPLIKKIHYVEIDSLSGVAHQAPIKSYDLVKGAEGYIIAGGGDIAVGRKGYFVVEASDRRNDVSNTFGLYRIEAQIDDEPIFEYRMECFSYSNTRYCNAIGYYPLMIKSRNEPLRLAAVENCDLSHYTKLVERGLVRSNAGQYRRVKVIVDDDCGNRSQLSFGIVGKSDDKCFVAEHVEPEMIVSASAPYHYSSDDLAVTIPACALYESMPFVCSSTSSADSLILSKRHMIFDYATPMQKPMTVSIKADVPFELRSKVGVVFITRSGYRAFIGGEYRYGAVTARSRNAGEFYVMADTQAPTIWVGIDEGSQQGRSSYFTAKISDDLSGVASFKATIDGEWIALNLDKGIYRHNFREKPTGKQHTLVIVATDAVGNSSEIVRTFTR